MVPVPRNKSVLKKSEFKPMNVFTHALAPVIICRCLLARKMPIKPLQYMMIGLAGAMPDLLNPHLSLDARLTSWSHGLPFWLLVTIVLLFATRIKKLCLSTQLAVIFSLSYLFHMFCDSISGGINWLYPWREFLWGEYWVAPGYWIPLDIFCILSVYYLFRFKPLIEKVKQAKLRSQGNSSDLVS